MKRFLSAIFLLFFALSCYNRHQTPEVGAEGLPANTTLSELYRICSSDKGVIAPQSDVFVTGTVTSSDKQSYISRELYIDDGTATAKVLIDMYNIASLYPEGARLTINLKGLSLNIENYQLQIGLADKSEPTLLKPLESEVVLDKYIVCHSDCNPLQPRLSIVSDLSVNLCGKLVTLNSMTHTPTHPDDTNIACGYHRFTDRYGNHTYIYIDQYSAGFGKRLPDGETTITGIVTWHPTIYSDLNAIALLPRYSTDIGM